MPKDAPPPEDDLEAILNALEDQSAAQDDSEAARRRARRAPTRVDQLTMDDVEEAQEFNCILQLDYLMRCMGAPSKYHKASYGSGWKSH